MSNVAKDFDILTTSLKLT